MALKTSFVVQPCEFHRKRPRPARQESAQSEFGPLKNAEALAARLPGAAALKAAADDETGELDSVAIRGQFGAVPDDCAKSLLSG